MSPDYNHLHLTIKSKLAAYPQNMPDKRPKSLSPAFLNQPNQTRQTQPTRLLNNQTKDNATKQQNKRNQMSFSTLKKSRGLTFSVVGNPFAFLLFFQVRHLYWHKYLGILSFFVLKIKAFFCREKCKKCEQKLFL